MTAPASAIVVAGGASRRLGQDKRQLRLGSPRTLLEATVATVSALADDVVVVVSTDPTTFAGLTARVVQDPEPGAGPLNALVAGLAAIEHDVALVVACDLPFLSPALLGRLLDEPRDYDLLVPVRSDGRLEMLHAMYRTSCLEPARRRLAERRLKLAGLADDVRARFVDESWLRRDDPSLRSFLNLNTPEDLRRVTELLAQARGHARRES
ncbi:MAG: molybdenum cofactor guanylyltransferase [Chloroflexota bacterium]